MKAEIFKETRKSIAGMTQVALATRLGITDRQVRNYEDGITPIPILVRKELLGIFNSTVMSPKALEWKEWMQENDIEYSEGSSVFALFDRNAGLPQAVSEFADPLSMLSYLRTIDKTAELDDYRYSEIKDARAKTTDA